MPFLVATDLEVDAILVFCGGDFVNSLDLQAICQEG